MFVMLRKFFLLKKAGEMLAPNIHSLSGAEVALGWDFYPSLFYEIL